MPLEKTLTACKQLRVRIEKKVPATPWDMLVLLTQPTPERADMKPEFAQAAATLAAVALQKRVKENSDITEDLMESALLAAMRALHNAQKKWEKEHPRPPEYLSMTRR